MSFLRLVSLVLFLLFAILFIVGVYIYNKFIRLRVSIESSWSDIDVLLKKRNDLVPNLVETVKGYASHEKILFERVTEARSRAMQATTLKEKAETENIISGALKSLFAVAESYPDLKASIQFSQLQSQLHQIENEIEYARRYYNALVRDYNTMIDSVPSNLIAYLFSFKKGEFFMLDTEAEREIVQVKF
ncbi:MAG: LemA family protein [Thermodesulfovibrionales bacterium]|nr:LemA family protein [Thermodesulfovibrionales bacterium]